MGNPYRKCIFKTIGVGDLGPAGNPVVPRRGYEEQSCCRPVYSSQDNCIDAKKIVMWDQIRNFYFKNYFKSDAILKSTLS